MDVLEHVQRKTMNMIKGLDDLPYEERLKELRLCSLGKGQLISVDSTG